MVHGNNKGRLPGIICGKQYALLLDYSPQLFYLQSKDVYEDVQCDLIQLLT